VGGREAGREAGREGGREREKEREEMERKQGREKEREMDGWVTRGMGGKEQECRWGSGRRRERRRWMGKIGGKM